MARAEVLDRLFDVIEARRRERPDGSYVVQLLDGGHAAIAAKVREESEEVVEATASGDAAHAAREVADLLFHTFVLMAHADVRPEQVYAVLDERFGMGGLVEKASRETEMAGDAPGGPELRVAIPSKGRLQEGAIELLRGAGLRFRVSGRRLFADCSNSGTRIIFCNTADIPVLVAEGVVDLGITGSDQVEEKGARVQTHRKLGFGRCHLAVAVHKDAPYTCAADLAGKVIGAKFVQLAGAWLSRHEVENVHILELQGAVEVMVLLGLVDGIVEIVETGSSLVENDLVELDRVLDAEAVLIGNAAPRDVAACDRLIRRIDGVLAARLYSLLEYNCPRGRIAEATKITPGFSSPTVQPLGDEGWFSVKVMVEKDSVHDVVDALEAIGCVAILETDLLHARL